MEAAIKGEEMLAFVLEAARQDGDQIPDPDILRYPEPSEVPAQVI